MARKRKVVGWPRSANAAVRRYLGVSKRKPRPSMKRRPGSRRKPPYRSYQR